MEPSGGSSIAGRLGLGRPDERDDAFAWRCLLVILTLYTISFAAFYPNAATNDDEAQYLRQAQLVLEGRSLITRVDPFTGEVIDFMPTSYAPGLAALMAPFVKLFGWRGAYVIPMLGLLSATLLTGLLLRDEGRSPIFALVLFGFAPALVMSRVAMSDIPSAAVVALGLVCFFRGIDRSIGWWLVAGFVAGSSITVRFTNPLVFVPLFAGTVIRREVRSWALVIGGLAGLGVRVAAMTWYFGDPFFERAYYPFAPDTLLDRLPYYAVGLLVLVPGGLVFGLLYRGRRRIEVVVSITLFLAFYLLQRFSTEDSGAPKRLVLTMRYVVPMLPLMALGCAESVPRLWRGWIGSRTLEKRAVLERRASRALVGAIAAVVICGVLVHPAFYWWSSTQARIRDTIQEHVPLDGVLVTNFPATRKFVRELERKYLLVGLRRSGAQYQPDLVRKLVERHPEVYLVYLDKSDTERWRMDAARNARLIEALERDHVPLELLADEQASPTDHLRIWRVAHGGDEDEARGGEDRPTPAR